MKSPLTARAPRWQLFIGAWISRTIGNSRVYRSHARAGTTPKLTEEDLDEGSVLSFRAAVLMVVAGMIWGIVMGVSQDHSTFPAHAHLNLLGWVSLFLFGIYYHLHPAIDRDRLASVQVLVWIPATVVLTVGVALVHSGDSAGHPMAAVGSLVILADMLLFGWLVYRQERTKLAGKPSTVPAE